MSGFNNHTYGTWQADVKTADQWREFILGGRSKIERPVANNTKVRLIDGGQGIAIRLHQTDIVVINADGTLTLNSGGWRTSTTKERINCYTNAGISQRNSVWYMRDGSLFYDGMAIRPDGTPVKPVVPEKYERKLKVLKKQAKQYAHDFVEALKAGKVGLPSSGDCWGCFFALSNSERVPAESRGKSQPFGLDHLRQHMREKYYVPSLLVNAGREAGYRDEQMGLMGIGGHRLFIEPDRVIYKYMVKHLQIEL